MISFRLLWANMSISGRVVHSCYGPMQAFHPAAIPLTKIM